MLILFVEKSVICTSQSGMIQRIDLWLPLNTSAYKKFTWMQPTLFLLIVGNNDYHIDSSLCLSSVVFWWVRWKDMNLDSKLKYRNRWFESILHSRFYKNVMLLPPRGIIKITYTPEKRAKHIFRTDFKIPKFFKIFDPKFLCHRD